MKLELARHARALVPCAALTILIGLGGCKQGPDYVRPPVPHTETYQQATPAGESIANVAWSVGRMTPRGAKSECRTRSASLANVVEAAIVNNANNTTRNIWIKPGNGCLLVFSNLK